MLPDAIGVSKVIRLGMTKERVISFESVWRMLPCDSSALIHKDGNNG